MRTPMAIGHLDADTFYCSAERVRFEFLKNKPLAVLGNQGACVIAKTPEMKAFGVKTGEPIWEALTKCPLGIYMKRDFRWYEVLSRMMLELMRDTYAKVEYYSIDEFFFEVPEPRGHTYQQEAERIRDKIWEVVRIPVTVGIGRSRTLAKLISDGSKPKGAAAVLDEAEERTFLEKRPVTEITGIAGKREKRLLPWGIRTCLDLAQADRRLIRELLTATGELLLVGTARGEAVLPIHARRPLHKILSRGGSFGEATDRPLVLYAWMVRNLERLIEELQYHHLLTAHVTLWVGYRDGRAGEGRASLEVPTDRFDSLLDALRACLRQAWIRHACANRMHILADKLLPRAPAQLGLFDHSSSERIADLKRQVNQRLGRFALRSAATLPLYSIYQDRSNSYDICDVRGKICF